MTDWTNWAFLLPTLFVISLELYFAITNPKRTISYKVWRLQLWIRVTIAGTCLGTAIWLFGHFTWKIWA